MSWNNAYSRLPAVAALALFEAVSIPVSFAQDTLIPQISQISAIEPQSPATPVVSAPLPLAPPSPEQVGDALMSHQRYQAAIEAYKKGPRDSANVWNKMGIAYQLMLNLDEAMHCYEKSLRIDPKNSVVLNNLGTVYDSRKEYPNAERMYHRALKFDPKSALINKNLGTNLLTQHRYKKGWERYKEALALDPEIFGHSGNPRVENPASLTDRGAMNYYMARSCVKAGMTDRAIDYLRMALNEGFTNPKKIMADGEFARLHGLPAFEQLLVAQSQAQQGTP